MIPIVNGATMSKVIKKVQVKTAGKVIKAGSFTYNNRAMRYRSLAIKAIKNGNEHAAYYYTSLCATNAKMSLAIETRMLRHTASLIIRTLDAQGGFLYNRLISCERVDGKFIPQPL